MAGLVDVNGASSKVLGYLLAALGAEDVVGVCVSGLVGHIDCIGIRLCLMEDEDRTNELLVEICLIGLYDSDWEEWSLDLFSLIDNLMCFWHILQLIF